MVDCTPELRSKHIIDSHSSIPKIEQLQKLLAPYAGLADLRFLEIGVMDGLSTRWLFENILTHKSARVTCIDTFAASLARKSNPKLSLSRIDGRLSEVYMSFLENTAPYRERLELFIGKPERMIMNLPPNSFDFICLDRSFLTQSSIDESEISQRLLKKRAPLIAASELSAAVRESHMEPSMVPGQSSHRNLSLEVQII